MFLFYSGLLGDYGKSRSGRLRLQQCKLLCHFLSEGLLALELWLGTGCLGECWLVQERLVDDLLHRFCLLSGLSRYDWLKNGLVLLLFGLLLLLRLRLMPRDRLRANTRGIHLTLLRLGLRLE